MREARYIARYFADCKYERDSVLALIYSTMVHVSKTNKKNYNSKAAR